ncbi:unnamed protein product [Rotaria sordida]|uniref:Uncharacterized protein n=1 Tax=Rotaria sordida TaxID=392033 RepID=A0A819N514_9BILA|nr:unnamed protein product [Rotaria sordida]
MKTFDLNRPINGADDLSDGVIIAMSLKNIDANHFNDTWLQKITINEKDNYRIKILGQPIVNFQMPDVYMIAESTNEVELSRLLQLVLGCAVNCERKRCYIEHIRSMEESVQHILMNAIQELMNQEYQMIKERHPEIEDQLKHALEELNHTIKVKDEIENHCHELDRQIAVLQNDNLDLIQEVACLNERIQQYERAKNAEEASYICFNNLQQQRIQSQQDEISELEISTFDRFKTELESTIDAYKTRLEDMIDLQKQAKYLEETNFRLMDEKSNLEHEYKQTKLLQTQIEFHKKINQTLNQKISEIQITVDNIVLERRHAAELLDLVTAEKESLMNEIKLLRKANKNLRIISFDDGNIKCSNDCIDYRSIHLDVVQTNSQDQFTVSLEDLKNLNSPADVRKHLIHSLQEENHSEQILLLEADYQQLKDQNNQLTNDLWMANQKILELNATLKDTTTLVDNSTEVADLKKSLNYAMSQYEQESIRMQSQINELKQKLEMIEQQLTEKDALLMKKAEEIDVLEKYYLQYLEKAKMIIRQMDPHSSHSFINRKVQSLQQQLNEKNRRLCELEDCNFVA